MVKLLTPAVFLAFITFVRGLVSLDFLNSLSFSSFLNWVTLASRIFGVSLSNQDLGTCQFGATQFGACLKNVLVFLLQGFSGKATLSSEFALPWI